MCGIIGYVPREDFNENARRTAFERLFEQSCIRGMHAYGIASKSGVYRTFVATEVAERFQTNEATIAHARYSQSGDWRILENNQPIVVDGMALAHNGVISMGTKEEYEAEFGVQCSVDNDSEIFLRKIAGAQTPEEVARKAEDFVGGISGSFAGTFLAFGKLFALRNLRRPLWRADMYGATWYASTEDIFRRGGFVGMMELGVRAEWI